MRCWHFRRQISRQDLSKTCAVDVVTVASTGAYQRCTHASSDKGACDGLCVCVRDVLMSRFQDLQSLLKGGEEGLAYFEAFQVRCLQLPGRNKAESDLLERGLPSFRAQMPAWH